MDKIPRLRESNMASSKFFAFEKTYFTLEKTSVA